MNQIAALLYSCGAAFSAGPCAALHCVEGQCLCVTVLPQLCVIVCNAVLMEATQYACNHPGKD
jgi:hypothetical protein